MKVFTDLKELLWRICDERRLLYELFQARQKYDVSYDDALQWVDDERKLRLLIDYGVVRMEGDCLELEETYQKFFEEVLQLNENITSASVEESLNQLRDNIDFYLKERDNQEAQARYVRKITRSLRNIATQAATKTVELKNVINDTYRQERNYAVKRQKLENNLATIRNIEQLIHQTESTLNERTDTLSVMIADSRIPRLVTDVRLRLRDVYHSLIELERTIRDYLHQIDAHNHLVRHIRRLKYLKDQMTWERATNVREMLDSIAHQPLETISNYSTKASLAFLRDTDEGLEAIAAAHSAISRKKALKTAPPKPLTPQDVDAGYIMEDFVDTEVIANAFFASAQDLYTFVTSYPYSTPKDIGQKVEFYTEILLNHHQRLHVTDQWRTDGAIDYPLIYNMP